MGSTNSKSKNQHSYSNASQIKSNNHHSSLVCQTQLVQSSNNNDFNDNDCRQHNRKQSFCKKKKVLILGFDGVGKTELFTRLISHDKKKIKVKSLPRPTFGYNVETIKLRCHHLYHLKDHKITLWDCGGHPFVRSQWSYHYSNTSLLLWLINIHDRSRLDINIYSLSQVLSNPMLSRVPVIIILYDSQIDSDIQDKFNTNIKQNPLTKFEVSFRFLATLSTSHASTFRWQVINLTFDKKNFEELKKLQQKFVELMEL